MGIETSELYADIVLPVAAGQDVFSYRVADTLRDDIAPGYCVETELGPGKLYAGVVWRIYAERPPYRNIKTIERRIPDSPVITPSQMRLWGWMAEYYMCGLGDVMRTALPSALKPKGFSREEFDGRTYKPRITQFVRLHPCVADTDILNEKCESLKRAKKQYDALLEFISLAGERDLFSTEVPRPLLTCPYTALKTLEKKRVIETVSRVEEPGTLPRLPEILPLLTPAQERAMGSIGEWFLRRDTVLLHGVTGSGKTEIYIHLINEELKKGRNVLYLLPEIGMTTQLVERVRNYFGDRVITYHSTFSDRARVEAYRRAAGMGGGGIILGVRSSVFLPAGELGLVIVDEEHDPSYKNIDFAPRYHARDSAIVLARDVGAKVLLGSATPSLESYANATGGKYGFVRLEERYGGVDLPEILISDTVRAVKRGERLVHFNKLLIDLIRRCLAAGEQVMLFQNRRGFSIYAECPECGWVASCPNCNVTLSLHKSEGKLRCHYCGYGKNIPAICPSCNHQGIEPRGFGTEKVEEELARIFPDARIARLDRDTARTVQGYRAVISSFEKGETDILVGTQMITKGFDFAGVSLVGILNADNLLAYPDFRASERAYQLMSQVAGRAGRRDKRGTVVIQTSQPENPLIRQVAAQDYAAMAGAQMADRALFFYPPYCRLISVTLAYGDREILWEAANILGDSLRTVFGRRLNGPQPPPVDRIKRKYLLSFLLKVERDRSFAEARRHILRAVAGIMSQKSYRNITVTFDVDPQ